MELSIVMPCLNEELTIGGCIREAFDFIRTNNIKGEVVIGDNGSTDKSIIIAKELGARVIPVKKRGYGAALQGAIEASAGQYIVMGDSDGSYDFGGISPMLDKLRQGWDLVMGNRFRGRIHPGAMPWKNRWIGNPALSFIGRLFYRVPIGDFHSGLRGFSRDAFSKMNVNSLGMEFASEMVVKASLLDMRVTEVPIELRKDGRNRAPHLRPWRDGWAHTKLLLLFSPKWSFLFPGIFLLTLGLLGLAAVVAGPFYVGELAFDVNTLVFLSAFAFVGFSVIIFSLLTNVYGVRHGILPETQKIKWLFKKHTVDLGILAGVCIFLLGCAGALLALELWSQAHFGRLNPREALRVSIPAALALALGIQTIFSSFFLNILRIEKSDT